jgi:polar amino acid transport system substrate-binding protein
MVAVLQAVCTELKRSCRIEVMSWRRALALAERGVVDGVLVLAERPPRRSRFHHSVPIVESRHTLFARACDDFRLGKDRSVLRGRSLAAYGPSATSQAMLGMVAGLDVPTVIEAGNLTLRHKLAAGAYGEQGLALVNENVALHLIREHLLGGLQAAGRVKEFSYSFALVRARVGVARQREFDVALNALCRSGRTAALLSAHGLPASACARSDPESVQLGKAPA